MTRRQLSLTVVVVLVVILSSLWFATRHHPGRTSNAAFELTSLVPTASVDPSSLCTSTGGFINQSFNGNFSGCFRVPALHSSSLVVALEGYLDNSASPQRSTTTLGTPSSKQHVVLSLRSRTARPGEKVTVVGRYIHPPTQRASYANLCWDGCQNGLQEQGVPLHWTSAKTFRAVLRVPATAWIESSARGVSVHPLLSGNYSVGVQCLGSTSGCALGPGDAQTTLTLRAPVPTQCVVVGHCARLQINLSRAVTGEEVLVKGWAPLQSIIGVPFSYDLSIASASSQATYPNLSYSRFKNGGGFDVVLAPTKLSVAPGATWADMGRLGYQSSTWAGPSAIAPQSNSTRVAWCLPSGLQITGGPKTQPVASAGVARALTGAGLKVLFSSSTTPQCSSVLLDPRFRHSLYAGIDTEMNNSIPPIYVAGLYTTNGGATWQLVPTPAGSSVADFAGFTQRGDQVVAMFEGSGNSSGPTVPLGTNNGVVSVEVTTNGGVSWAPSTLGCPIEGPCVTFGPYQWGNCAMNGSMQALLGLDHRVASGVTWNNSSWVTSVNDCFAQQLVVTSSRGLLLLDASSQYPLLRSSNSGRSWSNVALPPIPGMQYGPDSVPIANQVLFAPDGSLYASMTLPSGTRQELFRLTPSATSWCQIPKILGSASTGTIGTLRVSATDLIWSQVSYTKNQSEVTREHVVALTDLRC